MKKIMPPVLFFALALLLSGCGRMVPAQDGLTCYTSFSPIHIFAQGVTAGAEHVTLLPLTQPQDGCLRAYALSEWDTALLSHADALIMGGRGLESFEGAVTDGPIPVVKVLDGLALWGQEVQVPMGDDEAGHLTGANPYLWLSPEGARAMCRSIAAAMIALDPPNEFVYTQNLAALEGEFSRLLSSMRAALGQKKGPVALMHEGLVYTAQALDLEVAARIDREPAADLTDAALEDAIAQIKASGARAVLIERQAPDALITAMEDAGFSVARIDTLQLPGSGIDVYFDAMRQNAHAIAGAMA